MTGHAGPFPAWWSDRADGERIAAWVTRLQLRYRLARIMTREETDDGEHAA